MAARAGGGQGSQRLNRATVCRGRDGASIREQVTQASEEVRTGPTAVNQLQTQFFTTDHSWRSRRWYTLSKGLA